MLVHSIIPPRQIDAVYFSGFSKKDVAWLHKPTKTLIVADLVFNLPANEQYTNSKQRKTGILTKKLNPYTEFHKNFIWGESKDKGYASPRSYADFCSFVSVLFSAMARDAKKVAAWDFDRIIPCHGVSALVKSYSDKSSSLKISLPRTPSKQTPRRPGRPFTPGSFVCLTLLPLPLPLILLLILLLLLLLTLTLLLRLPQDLPLPLNHLAPYFPPSPSLLSASRTIHIAIAFTLQVSSDLRIIVLLRHQLCRQLVERLYPLSHLGIAVSMHSVASRPTHMTRNNR